jgi:DNA-directed RNA polymerase specialized sigma24 family protein
VVLCRLLGLPIAEAAELMGVEPSAVEAALTAARRALPQLGDTEAPLRHL